MKRKLQYWALAMCILAPLGARAQDDTTLPPAGFVDGPVDYVEASRFEIYKDFNAWWGENKDESILQGDLGFVKGVDYGVQSTAQLANPAAAISADAEVVLITSNSYGYSSTRNNVNSTTSQSKLREFVKAGGVLVVHLADNDYGGGFVAPGIKRQSSGMAYALDIRYVAPPNHPLSMGPDGLPGTSDDLTNTNIQWRSSRWVHHNWLQFVPSTDPTSPNYDPDVSSVTILATTADGRPLWAEWTMGFGVVIASDLTLEYGNDGNPGMVYGYGFPRVALRNELFYATHVDRVAPTTTIALDPAPPAGTWSNVPVTVTLTAIDNPGGSGVARIEYSLDGSAWTEYTGPFVVSMDGLHSLIARATDRRGNVETPGAPVEFAIDATAPAIAITTPAEGAEYLLGAVVLADWSVTDAMSGVASATGTVAPGQPIDTSSVGGNTFSVAARDYAGNPAEALASYFVRYGWCGGFQPPLNADGSSVFRQGSTVPVKFHLCDASGALQSGAIAELYIRTIEGGVVVNEAISTSAATEGNLFRYDPVDQQYIFNLSTKKLDAGKTYELVVALDDGSVHTLGIGLR